MIAQKVQKTYLAACRDQRFVSFMIDADGDYPPDPHASDQEKALYAAVYYGWLLAEHGEDWEQHI